MFDDKIVNTLTSKVNELLERYNELVEDNERLRNELVSAKATIEAQNNDIIRLQEELKAKNIVSENIIGDIEAVLGK